MDPAFYLAEINVARLKAPLDHPMIAPFATALDPVNALADASAGFVWRLVGEAGDATDLRPFDDPDMLINMSVWQSIETLYEFAYKTAHTAVMSQRGAWFERMTTPYMALWWVPIGTIPEPEEGKARLKHLELHGATAEAFTFKERFPMPQTAPE